MTFSYGFLLVEVKNLGIINFIPALKYLLHGKSNIIHNSAMLQHGKYFHFNVHISVGRPTTSKKCMVFYKRRSIKSCLLWHLLTAGSNLLLLMLNVSLVIVNKQNPIYRLEFILHEMHF